jgi:chorismate-pyruvate lyase
MLEESTKALTTSDARPKTNLPIESAIGVRTCPKFLALLGEFYDSSRAAPPILAELVGANDIPEPYRGLLAHTNDMTPTLERFHGEKVGLRVLNRHVDGSSLRRHILLAGERTRRPVEYGAIRIWLESLDEKARRDVLACRTPLGRILESRDVAHRSCPGGFFKIKPTPLMARLLETEETAWLYGRCNCLSNHLDGTIAEVVEILPQVSREER